MIDTAEKRRSVSGVAGVPLIPGVTPNASESQAWRQESAWNYSGITVSPPIVVGQIVAAVWLALPGNRDWTAEKGNREWTAEPGARGWLAEGQS